MPTELIYHPSNSAPGDVSPFDEAIIYVVEFEDVKIACPYLGLAYLQRIISLSQSWKILTDVEEWLASHNQNGREQIQKFIADNSARIHHCRDLHAKVIVAGNKALLGSANFTNKGITQRIEVSVLFEHEPEVEELREWFDNLWKNSPSINENELVQYMSSFPIEATPELKLSKGSLRSTVPQIRTEWVHLDRRVIDPIPPIENAHQRLIERVRLAPSRGWINQYFDLMKELFVSTGLTSDDARLVTSIPNNLRKSFLPVTINNRYVLASFREDQKFLVGIIYGAEFEQLPELRKQVVRYGYFKQIRGEQHEETPLFLRF
ncbi:MAG: phospholipase D-like domain-containing protein, partial [Abditibacteriaceae bacterium]